MSSSRPAAKAKSHAPKSNASEIAPGVFVGGWNDAAEFVGVRVCVLDDPPEEPLPGSTHVPIYDEKQDAALPANLDRVARLVEDARGNGKPVIVFCGHGIRRGSLAGAWYLHRQSGISLDEAYERVRAVRPKIEEGKSWIGHWPPPDVPSARRTSA
ncbi:MAG: dual specificity protein phosphatase family protein [Thermoplasmata archaeon]|nr:dual specificity protein phosphatase family protein [Thermoplasmata archaeon]